MSLSLLFRKAVLCCFAGALPLLSFAREGFPKSGAEYCVPGPLPGLQTLPRVSISASGGFLVWEDNVADGKGLGIRAQALSSDLSKIGPPFRVNQIAPGDQEHSQVALLKDGGAVFVWQGGRQGFQHIYARFFSPSNTWLGGDVLVSSFPKNFQALPAVTVLENGNVVVVWGSHNQFSPRSMQDIYAQILSPTGEKIGGEFRVNQYTAYNQRNPAICNLKDGRFLVVWVSELQRSGPVDELDPNFQYPLLRLPSVDIFARIFNNDGTPSGGSEFMVNTANDACANPSIASVADGGFYVAWSQMDSSSPRQNRWDVFGRAYSNLGIGGPTRCINSTLYGDQFVPQVAASGTNYIVLWTSMGQDTSWEGIYGQALANSGSPVGSEFRVNSTTIYRQFQPAVSADGNGRLLAVWSAYSGSGDFDLFAQRLVADTYVPPAVVADAYAAPFSDPYLNNSTVDQPPTLDPPIPPSIGSGSNSIALGAFAGLFYETNGINALSAGAIKAVVADRGVFSAKLSLGGRTYSVSGKFNAAGDAVARISPGNLRALTLHLHQDADQIRGQLTDGQWTSEVLANRNGFSKTKSAPQAGAFMLDVPGAAASAVSPGGDSYGPVKVDALGNVSWTGSLADGSKITQKSTLSGQGLWPVYVSLYAGNGCLLGWVQVTNSTLNGQLVWIKPSGVAGKYYPAGFTNQITVAGISYGGTKVGTSSPKLTSGNRNLVLIGGGLGAPIVNPIRIETNNRVTNLGTNKLSLTISATTGLYRGTVVNPNTGKPVQFQGAVFDDWDVGLGYFLNPAQSGQALIAPAP